MNPLLRRLLRRKSRPHSGDWSENPAPQARSKPSRKLRLKRQKPSHSGDWSQHTPTAAGRFKRLGKLPQGIKKRRKLLTIVGGVVVLVVVIVIAAGVGGGKNKTSTTASTITTSTGPGGTTTVPSVKVPAHRSMLDPARLDPAVNLIKKHLGSGSRLIQVTISPLGVQVEYDFHGQVGFLLGEPTSSAIRKVTSPHLHPGGRQTFAVAVLDPAVPTALRAHAASVGGSGYTTTTLLLKPDPVTRKLEWTLFDATHPGYPNLVASVTGSGLRKAN